MFPFLLALLALITGAAFASPVADLFAAVRNDDPAAIEAALAAGAGIDSIGDGGQTPLMAASLGGSARSVALLLSRNADATIGEKDGYTPLHGAGFQGRAEVARLLLKDPRVPNEAHRDGFFPVHRACWGPEQRHTDTVRAFLEAGEFDRKTRDGKGLAEVCARNKRSQALVADWGSAAEEL